MPAFACACKQKHSPPFVLVIIPDTSNHLKLIPSHYEERMGQLASNEYFIWFVDNPIEKYMKCNKIRLRDKSVSNLIRLTDLQGKSCAWGFY
jgi:CBL proto-oncogene N-terminal domain 1